MLTNYVVCLLFNDDLSQVCLIEKQRPDWQVGLLNGPGGKIEPGETVLEAATREFKEETGVCVTSWAQLCMKKAHNNSYQVNFLVAADSNACHLVRTTTDEQVGMRTVKHIDQAKLVSSIDWVLPLAIYALSGKMDEELVYVNF
jgi:8-oxo-dGTP pyrophosphatase MutT (NUDIX family)